MSEVTDNVVSAHPSMIQEKCWVDSADLVARRRTAILHRLNSARESIADAQSIVKALGLRGQHERLQCATEIIESVIRLIET